MFCPKCGQSQASDALRFCPRCGFPLPGVAELLARDGAPAYAMPAPAGPPPVTARRQGLRQGGMMMMIGLFLIPLIAMMHPLINLPGEYSLIGVIAFLLGLMRLLYALIFEDNTPRAAAGQPLYAPPVAQAHFDPRAQVQSQLPPQQYQPAQGLFPRRADTAEMARPPASVTDHTTRLLADQDDAQER